jgi:hypothetical protein
MNTDMTYCTNTECEKRKTCKRAYIPRSEIRNWLSFARFNNENCDHYIKCKEGDPDGVE